MDLARMICDMANSLQKCEDLSKSYVVEISYYNEIDEAVSKGIYVYPDSSDMNVVVCKYDGIEYKTRCFAELLFINDMILPNIIATCAKCIVKTRDDAITILSSTQYLSFGLHKFNSADSTITNTVAFFYHYFDTSYSPYDILHSAAWDTHYDLIRIKALVNSMHKLLVMSMRRKM
jgi:hypothetical protein